MQTTIQQTNTKQSPKIAASPPHTHLVCRKARCGSIHIMGPLDPSLPARSSVPAFGHPSLFRPFRPVVSGWPSLHPGLFHSFWPIVWPALATPRSIPSVLAHRSSQPSLFTPRSIPDRPTRGEWFWNITNTLKIHFLFSEFSCKLFFQHFSASWAVWHLASPSMVKKSPMWCKGSGCGVI